MSSGLDKKKLVWQICKGFVVIAFLSYLIWGFLFINSMVNWENYQPEGHRKGSLGDVLGRNNDFYKDCEIKAYKGEQEYLECLEGYGIR